MMRLVKPYPAYKDSGVEWLGDVPEHWDVPRLKRLATINPSRLDVASLPDYLPVTFLPMEKVSETGRIDRSLSRPILEVRNGFTYFKDGDVIVAKITPCFENGKAALVDGLENGFDLDRLSFMFLGRMVGLIVAISTGWCPPMISERWAKPVWKAQAARREYPPSS